MTIGLTSARLLNGQSGQGVGGSFWFDPTPGVPASCLDDPQTLPDAQLASLRLALEFDFGADLSGIRVYLGPRTGSYRRHHC
jgi:hypothetical protein